MPSEGAEEGEGLVVKDAGVEGVAVDAAVLWVTSASKSRL